MNTKVTRYLNYMTYYSILCLALFSFTSTSLSALSHILIIPPAIYYVYVNLREREYKISISSWALLGAVFFGIISVIFAPDISKKFYKISKLKYLLIGFGSIFAYRAALKDNIDKKKIKLLFNLFLLAVTLASISGVIGLFTGFNPLRFRAASESWRSTGMYGMAITYGYGIQLVAIFLTGLFIYRDKVSDYVNIKVLSVSWIVSLTGLYLSYTRGATLGFLVARPFLFYKKSKKLFWGSISLGTVTVAIVIFLIVSGNKLGDSRYLQSLTSDSNMIRVSQYRAAWYAFTENPLTGLGYRNFEPHSIPIKEKYNLGYTNFAGHAHNNVLEFLAGTGIGGFISIFLFHIFWFIEMMRRDDFLGVILGASVVAFIFSGQFQCTMMDGENMFVIMFLYAISQIRTRFV